MEMITFQERDAAVQQSHDEFFRQVLVLHISNYESHFSSPRHGEIKQTETCWRVSGKGLVQTGRLPSRSLVTQLHSNRPADLPEVTALSLAINHTFMQVGVYPSVTLK